MFHSIKIGITISRSRSYKMMRSVGSWDRNRFGTKGKPRHGTACTTRVKTITCQRGEQIICSVYCLPSRRWRRQNELHSGVRTTVIRFRLDVDININIERLIRFEIKRRSSRLAAVVHLPPLLLSFCTIQRRNI